MVFSQKGKKKSQNKIGSWTTYGICCLVDVVDGRSCVTFFLPPASTGAGVPGTWPTGATRYKRGQLLSVYTDSTEFCNRGKIVIIVKSFS